MPTLGQRYATPSDLEVPALAHAKVPFTSNLVGSDTLLVDSDRVDWKVNSESGRWLFVTSLTLYPTLPYVTGDVRVVIGKDVPGNDDRAAGGHKFVGDGEFSFNLTAILPYPGPAYYNVLIDNLSRSPIRVADGFATLTYLGEW